VFVYDTWNAHIVYKANVRGGKEERQKEYHYILEFYGGKDNCDPPLAPVDIKAYE
jgi:hypothetical protein